MNTEAQLLQTLAASSTYREYQRAFNEATGLPLAMRGRELWKSSFRAVKKENPFCSMIARQSELCAGCLQTQEKLCGGADEPKMMQCRFGLTEISVPIRLGHETIGYLVSGQALRKPPTNEEVEAVVAKVAALGGKMDAEQVRAAFLQSTVVSSKVLNSVMRLLTIFAEHLSMLSNQLSLQQANSEPVVVTRVKEFVKARYEEDITLPDAARAAHTSTFYLCKVFKKATGMCFTEFVSRTRVEKAKELLLHPNLRVSEVAYQVGFQSLTHFNRIFRKLVGESPSEYRQDAPMALAA